MEAPIEFNLEEWQMIRYAVREAFWSEKDEKLQSKLAKLKDRVDFELTPKIYPN